MLLQGLFVTKVRRVAEVICGRRVAAVRNLKKVNKTVVRPELLLV